MSEATAPKPKPLRMSAAEYLDWEVRQEGKHEFHDGLVVAMAGGSIAHMILCRNVYDCLKAAAKPPCEAFTSEVKVSVKRYHRYVYPDATVVCGEIEVDPDDPQQSSVLNPKLACEVISPSSIKYDTTEKFQFYRSIDSLDTYLIVEQDQPRVDVYSRLGGNWRIDSGSGLDAEVEVPNLGFTLRLRELYARVAFGDDDDAGGG